MQRLLMPVFVVFCLTVAAISVVKADDDTKVLQGVWIAQSMESGGQAAPAEDVKRMRFTFKGDKLLIVGNHDNDREDECTYTLDATKSPKHFDFTPPKGKKAVLGIYEVNGDELRICLRHARSTDGRPTEFDTNADVKLIMIVFKKQAP